MIERTTHEYSDEEIFSLLTPHVAAWFRASFGKFTTAQRYAIKEIHEGRNVLISSPTGSGKTLSAFAAAINEMFILARKGKLEDKVYALYVSPLKALNNDIEKNLKQPLREIFKLIENDEQSDPKRLAKIRVATRTGDTPKKERQAQTRKPPHILITTPETLAIVLNAPKFSEALKGLRWIIVDEIHALAENKRGVHLSLSLERLVRQIGHEPVRIGLSATIHPLEEIAKFLVGMQERTSVHAHSNGTFERTIEHEMDQHDDFADDSTEEPPKPRDCLIVDVNYLKGSSIDVISPCVDLIYSTAQQMNESMYAMLDKLISEHKTTLIFTNTRSATERVTFHLKNKFGKKYFDCIGAHHSSLSREMRLEVEEKLKKGELKVVVTSTSLELGIDIGYIDLVVLLGSPKGIARTMQRIGRSGHKLHDASKGRIIVLDRDDLVESIVLAKQARERKIDSVRIPENCLDVLSQHLVGMSLEKKWDLDEAYALVRRAYPFRELPKERLVSTLKYLGGHYEALEEKHVYGKLWFDDREGKFGRRGKMTRAIYCMNVGTIPEEIAIKVMLDKGVYVGKVDEDFIEKLLPGDIFVLGGKTYAFKHAHGMICYVERADSKRPTVPMWFSEQLPLSYELGLEIQRFRGEMKRKLETMDRASAIASIQNELSIDENTSLAVYNYFNEQYRFAILPTDKELLIEEYVDDDLKRNYIFHCLVGKRVNESIARAFGQRVSEVLSCNVGISVSDNGFIISLPPPRKMSEELLKGLVHPRDVAYYLRSSLDKTEILKRRFRHVATRSFLILRKYIHMSNSVGRQQMSAHVLLSAIKKMDKSFPVLVETYREIMEDAMDVENARNFLEKVHNGEVRIEYLQNRFIPSPFAFNLVLMGNSDTILMEDRREMVRLLHQRVLRMIDEREHGGMEHRLEIASTFSH